MLHRTGGFRLVYFPRQDLEEVCFQVRLQHVNGFWDGFFPISFVGGDMERIDTLGFLTRIQRLGSRDSWMSRNGLAFSS